MRKPKGRWFALLAVLAFLTAAPGTALAAAQCAAPEGFPNPQLLETMRRGVNLPGWDHPDPARRPTVEQLSAVRGEGFTHIRLLVERPPVSDDEQQAFAEILFEQIVLLLSLDFTVSVDLHAGHLAEQNLAAGPDEARAYLSAIWRRLVPAIRAFDPGQVAVELLNEPPAEVEPWNQVADGLIADLRHWLPDHTIVFGPAGPQRHETLAGMEPFADPNVIYAVHYYDPFPFTHQGANWGGLGDPLQYLDGLPFPAKIGDEAVHANIAELRKDGRDAIADELERSLSEPWTAEGIADAFSMMADWSERHGRPVIVNEFGALTFVAPRASRLKWLEAVSRQAEARCIGWTHWDFKDGFGLMDPDTGMPDQGVIDALMKGSSADY